MIPVVYSLHNCCNYICNLDFVTVTGIAAVVFFK